MEEGSEGAWTSVGKTARFGVSVSCLRNTVKKEQDPVDLSLCPKSFPRHFCDCVSSPKKKKKSPS